MSNMIYESESYGDTAIPDMAACEKAMRTLQEVYPDHPWLVGVDHFAGMLDVRLLYGTQAQGNNGYGFRLYLSTVEDPGGEMKLKRAGGECLERFRLLRARATEQSAARALQNGLDLTNIVHKSNH